MENPEDATSATTGPRRPIKLSVRTEHGTYARYEAGTIDWTECDAIERDPDDTHRAWRFKTTGTPLASLFHALAGGSSAAEFVRANNGVKEHAPARVLEFMAEQLEDANDGLWHYGGPRTARPPLLDGGEHNRYAAHDPECTHWKDCARAWRNAERMSGAWCIRDSRFPLSDLFRNLASLGSVGKFTDTFSVTADDTLAVLRFLAHDLQTVPNTRGHETTKRREPSTDAADLPPATRNSTD